MKLIYFPDERLFQVAKEVKEFTPELKELLESMWTIMKEARGLGLAANQVGLPHRMFIMEGPSQEKIFLVNPVITKKSVINAYVKEGCLSAPEEFFVLDRASWVEVSFKDENGSSCLRVFKDVHAVCVQHEMGHLDGESFLESKSIPKNIRKQLAKKWGFKLK